MYKDDKERVLEHYTQGEDPHDPKIFFNDLKEIFENTEKMIREIAKKEGISLDEMQDGEVQEYKPVDPKEYVIYRYAQQYCRDAHALIEGLEKTEISDAIAEDWGDFVWYHTLIPAKVARLVSGFGNDFLDEESRKMEETGTLQVIRKGLALSQQALKNMLNELPDEFYDIADLLELLSRLEKQIDADIHQKVGATGDDRGEDAKKDSRNS